MASSSRKKKRISMKSQARARLLKEFEEIREESFDGVMVEPDETNFLFWKAAIFGPEKSEWEEGVFNLTMEFEEDYPFRPPNVYFTSKMFHPNIDTDGFICVDMLNTAWSSANTVKSILTSIRSLLCDPNPKHPVNEKAAALYRTDRDKYNRKIRLLCGTAATSSKSADKSK